MVKIARETKKNKVAYINLNNMSLDLKFTDAVHIKQAQIGEFPNKWHAFFGMIPNFNKRMKRRKKK